MTEFVCFLVGLFLGGIIVIIALCCLQLKRVEEYEAALNEAQTEIEELKQELSNVRVD